MAEGSSVPQNKENPFAGISEVIAEADQFGLSGQFMPAIGVYREALTSGKADTQIQKSFCHLMIANYQVQLQTVENTLDDIHEAEKSVDEFNIHIQQIFYNTYCAYYACLNDAENCQKYADKVLALNPDSRIKYLVYINLSKVLLQSQPAESANYSKKILDMNDVQPIQKGSALINLAGASLYLGNIDDVIKYSTEATKDEYCLPDVFKGIAFVNLAAGQLQKGLYEEALESSETAVKYHPGSREAYQNQAIALGKLIVEKGKSELKEKAVQVRDHIAGNPLVFTDLAEKITNEEAGAGADDKAKFEAVINLFERGFINK